MPAVLVTKSEVACELLDRAIELHLRGDSYYAALHLGGAAEELLSISAREVQVAPDTFLKPAFDQMKEAIVALSNPSSRAKRQEVEKWAHDRMNAAKNSIKHKRGVKDDSVNFDAKEESYDMIDRAITTYFQLFSILRLRHIPLIQEFDQRRRAEQSQ
jgi:hypothetical protein